MENLGLVLKVNAKDLKSLFMLQDRDYFSIEGCEKLIEIFEELSEEIGKTFQVDIIALCCQYAEYDNMQDFKNDYDDFSIEDMIYYELSNGHILVDSES